MIWDYSKQNIEWLKQKGVGKEIKHVEMNYAPTLEIKKDAFEDEITEDIDILFIGALNPRRQAIFDQLKAVAPNLNIVFKNNAWGIVRNELIARAKIILNIHFTYRASLKLLAFLMQWQIRDLLFRKIVTQRTK